MLRRPRPIPQRFSRPVTAGTRRVVERRLDRRREYLWQRWQRTVHRWQRKLISLRKALLVSAVALTCALLVLGVCLALFSSILHVREIRVVRDDPRIDVEKIQRALAPLFGSHLFFLSEQELIERLRLAVPDLRDVLFRKQYPSTVEVRLTLDPIIARLVIEDPDHGAGLPATGTGQVVADAPKGADFLTSEGVYVVYPPGIVPSGSGLVAFSIVDWGARPAPWHPLLDRELLEGVRRAEEELTQQFGHTIRHRTIFLRAREFHLQTETYTLWIDLRSPLALQWERYRHFLETAGRAAAKRYVDLRIADRIIYQ